MTSTVGIDDLGVYSPPFALDLTALAAARGVPAEKITAGLGAREMAVVPSWEDPVTLGAQACERLFAGGAVRRDDIGMLLVATETAVDHAKPVGIFIHELLALPSSCRTVELKHACYGGTAGLMLAVAWLRSGAARGRKALVVATDIARYDLGSSAEFTQGAGAVALVLSEAPRFLELDPTTGVFARNVYDFWRPLDRREALVDGKFSVDCYLEALDGAHADWAAHGARGALIDECCGLLYHTPFPKMASKAHARLVAREWARLGRSAADLDAVTADTFRRLVEPSLGAARRMGNTYTASLYVCLASFAEAQGAALPGGRVALFSYGSGCCAEFFTGRFAADSAAIAARFGLARLLDQRRMLSVPEYEACARATAGDLPVGRPAPGIRFAGVRDDKRVYQRAEAGA